MDTRLRGYDELTGLAKVLLILRTHQKATEQTDAWWFGLRNYLGFVSFRVVGLARRDEAPDPADTQFCLLDFSGWARRAGSHGRPNEA